MLHNFAAEKEDRLAAAGLKAPPQPPVAAVLRLADPDVRRPGAASAIPVFRQRVAADQHPAGGVPGPGLHRQLRPLDPPVHGG